MHATRSGGWRPERFQRRAATPAPASQCRRRPVGARGQTEPLAALIAVAVVCVAISVYAGFLSGLVPQLGADRSVGEGTTEHVWHAIGEDGLYDAGEPLREAIEAETLPQGYYVEISVTHVGEDGRIVPVATETFDPHARPVGFDPPADAERYERAIPIRHAPGDVQPGTLRVVVWS